MWLWLSGNRHQQYEEFEMPDQQQQQYSQMSDMQNLRDVQPPHLGYNKAEEASFGPGGGELPGTPQSAPEIERPPLRHIDKYIRPECPCLSKRYTVAVLTCVGFVISFGMRCNMGMAKLQFEHREKTNGSDGVAPIKWSVGVESAVDSSFFWGYLVTQVPGGFLASKYPANRIFGTAIACSCFLNLLVPGATVLHPTFLIIVRILQGLVEGVTYPACHGIWRFWAPPLERSRLATLAFCGSYAGVVLGMPLSGLLTAVLGWQAPFYFYGCIGLIWYLAWLWLTFEKPKYHPSISAGELIYIEQSIGETTNVAMPTFKTTPWKAFASSMPVYAIIVANICRSWNFYFLVLFQAAYLQTFNLKIAETGFVGALPHLLMAIIVPAGGLLADHVRKKGILSTTNVRKLFNCGGFGMEAIFFLVTAYANSATAATIGLTFGVAFSGFAISGYNVNHLDIAPRYASILMGMSNGIGTIAGLICPIVIDHVTSDHSRESWRTAFILAACVHFFGVTFYAIFASGELQSWAEPTAAEIASWGHPDDPHAQKKLSITPAVPPPPRPAPPPMAGPPATSTNPFLNYGEPAPSYGSLDQAQMSSDWGPGYGSMGESGSMPPIPYSNHVEPVQPEARDFYQQPGPEDWPINPH
ncbi:Hypothetical predicted protein [Cloeon dipterum]|uniref:Major facilitator superfamily (MFS) profile domain-containing protein n=1 Tax=Cloeon dipterum TaxID=197152 RepID=A0A8S1DD29_9INSE|nr:Hypothetical predicted protein [Cloeon dipterum]